MADEQTFQSTPRGGRQPLGVTSEWGKICLFLSTRGPLIDEHGCLTWTLSRVRRQPNSPWVTMADERIFQLNSRRPVLRISFDWGKICCAHPPSSSWTGGTPRRY